MRVALVGAGSWGKNHARILSEMGVLCAVCDADEERGAGFGSMYSVNHYGSVEELIGAEEFDAALVATHMGTHFDIAARLLEAKKHVFVEKPISRRSDKAQRLVGLAEGSGAVLTCGYIERFNPAVGMVKSRLDRGADGDLVALEFHRENAVPPRSDVSIIHDTAVHDIDAANWLFGGTPSVVFAMAGSVNREHHDFASIMLGYGDGKTAVISSSWITPRRVRTFSAVCTGAVITSDFISQEVVVEGKDGTETLSGGGQEPLRLEIESFLGAARGDNDPVVKPQEAVNVTRIAEAAVLSSRKGVPIYLELK